MDIENIVTDEFADYKVGFVNGKNDILNFLVGRVEFEEFSDIEDWYTMGYEDGYTFYYEYYMMTEKIPLEFIVGDVAWKIINDSFISRIVSYNEKNVKKIPVLRLQITDMRR